jgi:two-component system KDP operon response regulator KdpE
MLVDLGLPDRDGLDVIRRVRAWSPVPIVVLSARTAERQKVEALDVGADDYVAKPFGASELLARVRAALRRNARTSEHPGRVRIGTVDIDLELRTATDPARDVHLTPLEYRVLECLLRHAGAIVRSERLLREVWGPGKGGDTRALRVCMKNLRDKLEPDPRRPAFFVTETGLGYRLRLPPDRVEAVGQSGER